MLELLGLTFVPYLRPEDGPGAWRSRGTGKTYRDPEEAVMAELRAWYVTEGAAPVLLDELGGSPSAYVDPDLPVHPRCRCVPLSEAKAEDLEALKKRVEALESDLSEARGIIKSSRSYESWLRDMVRKGLAKLGILAHLPEFGEDGGVVLDYFPKFQATPAPKAGGALAHGSTDSPNPPVLVEWCGDGGHDYRALVPGSDAEWLDHFSHLLASAGRLTRELKFARNRFEALKREKAASESLLRAEIEKRAENLGKTEAELGRAQVKIASLQDDLTLTMKHEGPFYVRSRAWRVAVMAWSAVLGYAAAWWPAWWPAVSAWTASVSRSL